ncbi:MAG: hypothetical protein WC769_06840 [Thermodesulfovibrionales bacterium]|jgi:hypothetical protein
MKKDCDHRYQFDQLPTGYPEDVAAVKFLLFPEDILINAQHDFFVFSRNRGPSRDPQPIAPLTEFLQRRFRI